MRELVYPNVKNFIFRIKLPLAHGINNEDISSIIPEPHIYKVMEKESLFYGK